MEWIGYIAGTLTTASFLPQVIKTVRDKNVNGLSLLMYIVFTIGVFGWLIYGIVKSDMPIIVFNSITLILTIAIIANIIKYKR